MTDNPDSNSAEVDLDGFPQQVDHGLSQPADSLDLIVSDFAAAVRRGERPSVESFVRRQPAMASEIREMLKLISTLEQWKVEKETDCFRRGLPDQFQLKRLGNYEITGELGRGGMGVVFEARAPSAIKNVPGKKVAVKLFPWKYISDLPEKRQRFLQEARTIATLNHRNIVPILDFGEHDGYWYYVMQLVEGMSLEWVIKRLTPTSAGHSVQKITPEEIRVARGMAGMMDPETKIEPTIRGLNREWWTGFALIGAQVAMALHHSHDRGVIHNDIKPGNLLLEYTGRVYVSDFGGYSQTRVSGATDPGVGTLRYMAPERFRGEADRRSDLYSLGITLYELVTQKPAFDAPNRIRFIDRIQTEQPISPRKINPLVPDQLEAIILKAINPSPEKRYQDGAEMSADLIRFSNGERMDRGIFGFLKSFWKRGT